jgi:hypothetical protein
MVVLGLPSSPIICSHGYTQLREVPALSDQAGRFGIAVELGGVISFPFIVESMLLYTSISLSCYSFVLSGLNCS